MDSRGPDIVFFVNNRLMDFQASKALNVSNIGLIFESTVHCHMCFFHVFYLRKLRKKSKVIVCK